MDHHEAPELQEDEKSIFDRPGTIRLIWLVLIGGCIGFAAAGYWLTSQHRMGHHPHFEHQAEEGGLIGFFGTLADHFPVFYGVLGFISFAFIVLAGQHLRLILMRDEDYYDKPDAPLLKKEDTE